MVHNNENIIMHKSNDIASNKEMDVLYYKGYLGTVEYSAEDECFYGKVLGITDLISYEGNDIDELRRDFRDGIDDYIGNDSQKITDYST